MTEKTKAELQELQFADTIQDVIIEEAMEPQFVEFVSDGTNEIKEAVYAIQPSIDCNDTLVLKEEEEEENPEIIISHSSQTSGKNKKFTCAKCDESFDLKVDYKVHLLSHPKELNHICNVCNKAFAEAKILKRHQKIHLDKKPHQCDICHMSFAESSNLSKHKKRHTGELRNIKGKPHLCSVCGRSFKWASSLSKHMKYHTGHKLLSCEHCGKQYVEVNLVYFNKKSFY